MKTLFLILLFLPLIGFSQYVDKNGKDLIYSGYSFKQDTAVYLPKLDTVKVVMMVSDTTRNTYSEKRYEGLEAGKPYYSYKTATRQSNDCYWQYGYQVGEFDFWTQKIISLKYLDYEKKPLKSEIIVWISKSITKN